MDYPTPLTPSECSELATCEAIIEHGLQTFYEVGMALLTIRDQRLYRAEYPTWEAYCRERWGWSQDRASQQIKATQVMHSLEEMPTMVGFLPANERQARPLSGLPPGQQREAWKRAVQDAVGEQLTARHVEAAVRAIKSVDLRDAAAGRREAQREQNALLVTQAPAVLDRVNGQRFSTVVMDPPWDWGDEGDGDQFGRARPPYATMPIEQIAELPVQELAQDHAHLYLWITNRSLPKGFGLLEHWGFRYITCLTWCKPSFGMGNYFRGSTEHILFGIQGSLPLLRQDVGTWWESPRPGPHSGKPDAFYRLVESCSPGPWLELFSRHPRPGWTAWGAET